MVTRVQVLANEGLNELPPQFIRPVPERPENSKAIVGVTVPVISMSLPHDVLVKEMHKAINEWGFFLLKDHEISHSLIERLQEVGDQFFRLPQEEKEKYANDASKGKFEGYGTKMTKSLDGKMGWADFYLHVMSPNSTVNYEVWPSKPSSYREVTEEYNKELLKVIDKILELLSEGLGLEKCTLKNSLGDEEIELKMKINMYPPCPQPELALGVVPHTDSCGLTLLMPNEVPGLQVWKDDNWVAVDFIPNMLVVQAGDQLEVLTNGKYKSALHRSVVNKDRMRMSWAVFCGPPREKMIGPLPEFVDEQNPAKYSTKTYAEFQHCKFNKLPQ